MTHPTRRPTNRFGRVRLAAALVLVAVLPAACGGGQAGPIRSPYEVRFSPNGEPMNGGPRGYPPCDEALGRWFANADLNHDGRLRRDEYLADARRQFAIMDLDRNGEVTPAELGQYRAPYATPPANVDTRMMGPTIRATFPDPVMSADTGLRFRVGLDAFLASGARRFADLSGGPDGTLTRAVVGRLCEEQESDD